MICKLFLNLLALSQTLSKDIWLHISKVKKKLFLRPCLNTLKMTKYQNWRYTTQHLFFSMESKVLFVEQAIFQKEICFLKSSESSRKCSTFTVSVALINQKELETSSKKLFAGSSTQVSTVKISLKVFVRSFKALLIQLSLTIFNFPKKSIFSQSKICFIQLDQQIHWIYDRHHRPKNRKFSVSDVKSSVVKNIRHVWCVSLYQRSERFAQSKFHENEGWNVANLLDFLYE